VAGGEGDDGGGTRGGGPGERGGSKRLAIRPRPLVRGLTAVAGGGGRRIGWRGPRVARRSRHVAAMAARTKILKRLVGKEFILHAWKLRTGGFCFRPCLKYDVHYFRRNEKQRRCA